MGKISRQPTTILLARAMTAVALLAVLVPLECVTAAETDAAMASALVTERPGAGGAPTPVTIDVFVLDIDTIDDVRQRFSIDLFMLTRWRDSRLALPEDQRSGIERRYTFDEIWRPAGLIVNDRGLTSQLPQFVSVDDDGNVTIRRRLSGELATDFEFREFPFDRQLLPIDIVSYRYSPDEVQLSYDSQFIGLPDEFGVEGWQLRLLEPLVTEFEVPGSFRNRTRMLYLIEATRDAQYYVVTMFLPMTLIVFMAWGAFWLNPELVPPRVGLSTGAIFSLIAFGFSIRLSLPAVSYMTRADYFVLGCTLLVFAAMSMSILGSRWASAGRLENALALNATARWLYVLLYLLMVAVTLLI